MTQSDRYRTARRQLDEINAEIFPDGVDKVDASTIPDMLYLKRIILLDQIREMDAQGESHDAT